MRKYIIFKWDFDILGLKVTSFKWSLEFPKELFHNFKEKRDFQRSLYQIKHKSIQG